MGVSHPGGDETNSCTSYYRWQVQLSKKQKPGKLENIKVFFLIRVSGARQECDNFLLGLMAPIYGVLWLWALSASATEQREVMPHLLFPHNSTYPPEYNLSRATVIQAIHNPKSLFFHPARPMPAVCLFVCLLFVCLFVCLFGGGG